MNKKPNLRMRKYTAPELPLLALLCGVATLTSSLFAVTAVPVTSDASECLIEINDDVLGDMDTNVTLSATGGTATVNDLSSSGADADASACAIAIDGDVVQNSPVAPILSATFDLTALGGAADASSFGDATSDTSAFVSGVDFIEGDFMGSITGEATGGDAEAYGGFYSDAYANADAYGNRGFSGDSTGSVDVTARGGIATAGRSFSNSIFLDEVESEVIEDSDSEYSYADASATAIASGGSKKKSRDLADSIEAAAPIEQFQAISGSYSASAFGGDSEANGIFSAIANSRASADGIVIDEIFQGEIDAEISAIAEGGDANAVSEEGSVLADASADAVGIRFDEGFIMFPEDEIESNLWQETDLIEGGEIQGGGILIPESTYNVYAQAIAINGTTFSDEISGALNATAVGGTAIFQQGGLVGDTIESIGFESPVSADAFAAGIAGEQIYVGNISGGISATATPGVIGYVEGLFPADAIEGVEAVMEVTFPTPEIPTIDYGYAANGYAFGVIAGSASMPIQDSDVVEGLDYIAGSSVNVTISSAVHAIVLQPEIPNNIPDDDIESSREISGAHNWQDNAYAAAVYGGSDSDYVELAEGANIIGDINTNGGNNQLIVTGDTIMLGDILSSSDWRVENGLGIYNGYGSVDFDIDSGLFTAVGQVNVSDLANQIDIASAGGLAPLISRDPELSSVVNVFGDQADVIFAEGSTVRPTFNGLEDWSNVLASANEEDQKFLIVSSTGLIDIAGAIADGSLSPFEIMLLKEDGSSDQRVFASRHDRNLEARFAHA